MPFPISSSIDIRHSSIIIHFRAPGERQTALLPLASAIMTMAVAYYHNHLLRSGTGIREKGKIPHAVFALSTETFLKMGNFVRVLSNFAPSPIVPARKLDTTSTVLSSGEALKKTNSVGILSNFRGPAGSTLAAIHYLRFFSEGVPIPKGSLRVGTIFNFHSSMPPAPSLKPPAPSPQHPISNIKHPTSSVLISAARRHVTLHNAALSKPHCACYQGHQREPRRPDGSSR